MKLTTRVLAPIAVIALQWLDRTNAARHNVEVATCAELQRAVELASSGNTVAVVTAGTIACDEWTTFEIKNHTFRLTAEEGSSLGSDHVYEFENVRFLVSSGALRHELAVSFTSGPDNQSQEVNGGVLNVAKGGYVWFGMNVFMADVTVHSVPDEGSDVTSDRWFGGCIYNQGTVRFQRQFQGSYCATVGGGESAPGNGGAIFNGETGDMIFKGELYTNNCGTHDNEGNLGGAIYNEGKMSMFQFADFYYNKAAGGGAIYNKGVVKFLKNSRASFRHNRTYDSGDSGGQVSNLGTILFKGGVEFEDGFTEANGGAISNTDTVIIEKSAVFKNNVANEDGGAIASPVYATFELPEDTIFEGNSVRYDDGNCDNWYQRTSEDNFDFDCLWE